MKVSSEILSPKITKLILLLFIFTLLTSQFLFSQNLMTDSSYSTQVLQKIEFYNGCGDYEMAIALCRQSLILFKRNKDLYSVVTAQIQLAYSLEHKGKSDSAMILLNRSKQIADQHSNKFNRQTGDYYLVLGELFRDQSKYSLALKNDLAALKIFSGCRGDYQLKSAEANMSLGLDFTGLKKTDSTSVYYERSFRLLKQNNKDSTLFAAKLFHNLAIMYLDKNMIDTAIYLNNQSIILKEVLSANNSLYAAKTYYNLGLCYQRQQKFELAICNFTKAMDIYEALHTIDVSDCLDRLIDCNNATEDFEKAQELSKKAMRFRQQLVISGAGMDLTASAQNLYQLGLKFQNDTQYDSAVFYYQKASPLFLKLRKWDSYLYTRNSLGYSLSRLDSLNEALLVLKDALKKGIENFGATNKWGSTSLMNIGSVYKQKKDYPKALIFYFSSVNSYKTIDGEQSENVALNYYNIASTYYDTKKYDSALIYYTYSLKILTELKKGNTLTTSDIYSMIGKVYYTQNKNDLALENYNKSLKIRQTLTGLSGSKVADSYIDFARVDREKREEDKAIGLFQKALNIYFLNEKNHYGKIADCYHDLWSIYDDLEQYDSALSNSRKALYFGKKIYNNNSEEFADLNLNHGTALSANNYKDSALYYYNTSLSIYKQHYNQNKSDLFLCCFNIGDVYDDIGEYDTALVYYFQSLHFRPPIDEESKKNVADIYQRIGNTFDNLGRYDSALDYTRKSIQLIKLLDNESKSDTTLEPMYENMGLIFQHMEVFDSSIYYMKKLLDMRTRIYGKKHQDVALAYKNIADCFNKEGKTDSTRNYFAKSIAIYENIQADNSIVASCYSQLVEIFRTLENFDSALYYANRSLELRKELFDDNHEDIASAYGDLANVYSDKHNFDKTLENYTQSMNIYRNLYGDTSENMAYMYYNLAIAYYNKSDYRSSIYFDNKARSIRIRLYTKINDGAASSNLNLGADYTALGLYDSAYMFFDQALTTYKSLYSEDNLKIAKVYSSMASKFPDLGRYDSALYYYNKCLKIYENKLQPNHSLLGDIYDKLSLSYANQDKYPEAWYYSKKAIKIRKNIYQRNNSLIASSYRTIAIIYSRQAMYDSALYFNFLALDIYKFLFTEKNSNVASTYSSICNIYKDLSEYDRAMDYARRALDIRQEIYEKNNRWTATSNTDIGILYYQKEEYDNSINYISQAFEIDSLLFGLNHISVGNNYINLGINYSGKKQFDLAISYYLKAKKIIKNVYGENSTDYALLLNNLGAAYSKKKLNDTAIRYYRISLEIYKTILGSSNPQVVREYNNIAEEYYTQKKYELALENFQNAIVSNHKEFNDPLHTDKRLEIEHYLDMNALLSSLKGEAITMKKMFETGNNKNYLFSSLNVYFICDSLITRIRQQRPRENDKIGLGSTATEIYEHGIDVCLKLAHLTGKSKYIDLAFRFSERNKTSVLLQTIAATNAEKFTGIPDSLIKRAKQVDIKISLCQNQLLINTDSVNGKFIRNQLFTLVRTRDTLVSVFEKKFPKYYELKYSDQIPSTKYIRKKIDTKTILLNYFVGDSAIYCFTLSRKGVKVVKFPKPKSFETDIELLTNSLSNKKIKNILVYKLLASSLYHSVFPKNITRKIENLIVIPDGALALLPFETLFTSEYNGKELDYSSYPYLLKKYSISYSYSASLLYHTSMSTSSKKSDQEYPYNWIGFAPVFTNAIQNIRKEDTLSVGNDSQLSMNTSNSEAYRSFEANLTPLPASDSEVNNIYHQFLNHNKPALVNTYLQANEKLVKSGILRNGQYLHFATHTIVEPEHPELSGIILANDSLSGEDGILHVNEIYNLETNANLVCLSACNTALGKLMKGEGIMGLTRALLYSGTKNVMVSLWEVADKSTAFLMESFYKNLLKTRVDRNYANYLREAKLSMINSNNWSNPYYWSPFILIGK